MTAKRGFVCTGQGTHPAAPAEVTDPDSDFTDQLGALYAMRLLQGRRARPSREVVTDGTMSMAEFAAHHGITPAEILRLTAEHHLEESLNRLFGESSDSGLADRLLSDAARQEPPPVVSHIEWRCTACRRNDRLGGRRMDRLVNAMFGPGDGDKLDISYDPPRWMQ